MAAYAALVSLINTVDSIQNHPRLCNSLDVDQIKSLIQITNFLLSFVESHGGISKGISGDLEPQIASAAHAAEVAIESHIVDLIHAGFNNNDNNNEGSLWSWLYRNLFDDRINLHEQRMMLDLQKILEEEMASIAEKVEEQTGRTDQQPSHSEPASLGSLTGKVSMVGFDGYRLQLLDRLTGHQNHRQIIPITGMGGIGKTTLARFAYQDPLIVHHFEKRAGVTVSQEFDVGRIISQTLSSLGEFTNGLGEKSEDDLGRELHKILYGRRYLVILDDMWSIEAWEKINSFFPENNNGSRVVVTTRQVEVAKSFGSSALALSFLDDDESWRLFCEKVFAEEGCACPPDIEGIGRNIVRKCGGLPLSIVVIGGLLAKSPRTRQHWENVEKDLISIVNSAEDNLCSDILSLSYSYLPAHLKPCFLYLGIFPEDHDIPVSRLIRFWIAEGFLKQNKTHSLEEIGEGYIKDLLDRNLILFRRKFDGGKHRICKVHDLIRDLCIKTAEEEKFFHVASGCNTSRDVCRKVGSGAHKIIVWEDKSHLPQELIEKEVYLFDAFCQSLDTIFEKRSLRFFEGLVFENRDSFQKLPPSLHLMWNLQTFVMKEPYSVNLVMAPSEIWEMPQLRHVLAEGISLPDPPLRDKDDHIVLRNLRTLATVKNFRCSEEVCKRMPNIKKLRIEYGGFTVEEDYWNPTYACLSHVGSFNQLGSLHYHFLELPNRNDLLQNLRFPSSLRKLTLEKCNLHWDDLAMIDSLPYLEVLKLRLFSVHGPEWSPVEGGFRRLKILEIHHSDIQYWNADSSHYPMLEKLHLSWLEELQEIPPGIGDIPTLGVISLRQCSVSAVISAGKILEEQGSLGNDGLKVAAKFDGEEALEEVRERVEMEGFPTHNFVLSNNSFFGHTPSHVYFGSSIRGLEIDGNPEIC